MAHPQDREPRLPAPQKGPKSEEREKADAIALMNMRASSGWQILKDRMESRIDLTRTRLDTEDFSGREYLVGRLLECAMRLEWVVDQVELAGKAKEKK